MADFVAKVPIAIGEGFHKASMQPLVAARSSRSGGCDALIPTPATQLQRYLTLRNTRNDRGRGPRHQFGETAQILGDGGERELELGAARSAQSQSAEAQDALEVANSISARLRSRRDRSKASVLAIARATSRASS
jgi:hypothetical protein